MSRNKKVNKYDLVVGIPTYNEEENVSFITKTVDRGLSRYFSDKKALILNVDSASEDKTRKVFKKTKTTNDKESSLANYKPEGKGANIFTMIDFGLKRGAKYFCTIDADITSASPKWIKKLIGPLIAKEADYVTPLYKRNRYEGNTTNHLCVPILDNLFGVAVRQPIGGEFSFNKKFATFLKHLDKPKSAYKYGIDIFLTTSAALNGFRIQEAFLGEKIHNPSFEKMPSMFQEVCETLFYLINFYHKKNIKLGNVKKGNNSSNIGGFIDQPSREKIASTTTYALKELRKVKKKKLVSGKLKKLIDKVIKANYKVSPELWEDFLAEFVKICRESVDFKSLSVIMRPIFLIRVLTYYEEIQEKNPEEVEQILKYRINNNV